MHGTMHILVRSPVSALSYTLMAASSLEPILDLLLSNVNDEHGKFEWLVCTNAFE